MRSDASTSRPFKLFDVTMNAGDAPAWAPLRAAVPCANVDQHRVARGLPELSALSGFWSRCF
jgi:hypothetical protein